MKTIIAGDRSELAFTGVKDEFYDFAPIFFGTLGDPMPRIRVDLR
jgi:hypothetical protein